MHQTIIIATSNKGKVREFGSIVERSTVNGQRSNLVFKTINEVYAGDFDPEETGTTFQENALIKAQAAAELLQARSNTYHLSPNTYILADDSGIEISALDGRPGIYSARYLKANGIEGVLKELGDNLNRQARFVCHISLVNLQGEVVFETEQYWTGNITHEARGTNGFGYDPIVIPDEYSKKNKTVAELNDQIKSTLSHRAKALIKVLEFLQK
jgi:XTP/dITP diphosphohydrolase